MRSGGGRCLLRARVGDCHGISASPRRPDDAANPVSFGTVCLGQSVVKPVIVILQRSGPVSGGEVFANGVGSCSRRLEHRERPDGRSDASSQPGPGISRVTARTSITFVNDKDVTGISSVSTPVRRTDPRFGFGTGDPPPAEVGTWA